MSLTLVPMEEAGYEGDGQETDSWEQLAQEQLGRPDGWLDAAFSPIPRELT